MKKILFLFTILCTCFVATAQTTIWTIGNARVVPRRHLAVSLFAPSRLGLAHKMVLSTRIAPTAFAPNISLKKQWYHKNDNYYFASRHSFHSTTLGLNLLQSTSYKDYIPDTSLIPFSLVMTNELLFSKWLVKKTSCTPPNHLLTLKMGLKTPMHFGDNTLPYFYDVPKYHYSIFYTEKTPVWYAGLGLDGSIREAVNYDFDVDFISIDYGIRDFSIQNVGVLILPVAQRLDFAVGYLFSWGTTPEGSNIGLYPLFDFVWTIKRKNKRDDGLFDKKSKLLIGD